MILDVRTAFILGAGFVGITALTLLLLSRTLPDGLAASARTGALATGTLALTWPLFAFEDVLPDLATVLFGNLLYLAAAVLIYQSVRLFDGLAPRRDLYLEFVLPVMLCTLAARYLIDAYDVRVIVMSTGVGSLLALSAHHLLGRRPTGPRPDGLGRRATGYWLLLNAAILFVRVGLTFLRGGAPPALQNGPLASLALGVGLVTVIGLIFAYFLLYTDRVVADFQRQAHHDPLTDLLNRRAFVERAEEERARAVREGRPLSLLLIDGDHFKHINDSLGHAAGDEALCAIADTLRSNLRAHDVIARLGGDEFAVLLPGLAKDEARGLVRRLSHAMADHAFARIHTLSVSVGLAVLDPHRDDIDSLVLRADQALYDEKHRRATSRVVGSSAAGDAPKAAAPR